jgi:hypothetical protein
MKIGDFYDDPKRGASEEVDFGSWQYHGYGPWRVVWLEATGELVAFNELNLGVDRVSVGGGAGGNIVVDVVADYVLEEAATAAAHGLHHIVHRIRHHARTDDGAGIPADLDEDVSLLTIEPDLAGLRTTLAGWEEHPADRDGLVWLADRLGTPL